MTANSGREGLELMSRHDVDAVLLDYAMPEMNGSSVAAEIKRRNPDMPVIILSAYMFLPDNELRDADAFVTKSDGPVAMLAALKRLLEERVA